MNDEMEKMLQQAEESGGFIIENPYGSGYEEVSEEWQYTVT